MKPLLLLALMMSSIQNQPDLDTIADHYVRLVLAVGVRDPDYVDAYYGPLQLKKEVKKQDLSYDQIRKETENVLTQLGTIPTPEDPMIRLRYVFLMKQLQAIRAFVEMRVGNRFSFDEESLALYNSVSPHFPEEHFARILEQLNSELPGKGDIQERYEAFQKEFVIPKDKLDFVFQIALKECRVRTKKRISLPAGESFTVEYVTKQPWGGYNWYQGNFHSLIQVNTDLPIYVDRAVDLAGHEGYPGHHVYNVLLEQELLLKRKWNEFSVYPLFSPQSLIAEGSANYGVKILFPGNERVEFEERVIFPAAGLNPARAAQYYKVRELTSKLSYAGNEAARRLLDGEWKDEKAINWLQKYSPSSRDRAAKRLDFIKKYRSYVINYNLGEDLIKRHVESRAKDYEAQWKEFAAVLGSPILPSGL